MDIHKLKQELKADIVLGKLKIYGIEEVVYSKFDKENNKDQENKNPEKFEQAIALAEEIRAEYFEEILDIKLDKIKESYIHTAMLKEIQSKENTIRTKLECTADKKSDCTNESQKFMTKGIELKIGTAKIPFAIAGPIIIKSLNNKIEENFHVPIATNEAALVAGLQRGIKCMNKSGGVTVVVEDIGMTRAPLLEAKDINTAKEFTDIINSRIHNKDIITIVDDNSLYTKFKKLKAYQMMNKIWLRFTFTTDEAMGMNSVVKHTTSVLKFLLEKYKDKNIKLISLTGNLCCDKKASAINVLEGRGKKVNTEIIIPEKIIKEVYGKNVSIEKIAKLNHWKNYAGSGLAGTITGFNANAANTIAGIFAATGQDLAQLVESSTCFTHAEIINVDGNPCLKFGVTMPCLEIGTVGGGMWFGTAKQALDIVLNSIENSIKNNLNKDLTKSMVLGGVIASAVTAQELNLLIALTNDFELCSSHIELARGEK